MSYDVKLHGALIGVSGSRSELNTPVLCLDRAALDRNIGRMADIAQAHGVTLRPHAKTHKSVEIARRQIAAGAAYLETVIASLAANGVATPIVTGSGTGTHRIDAELGVFTEWQVGSYVFMDRQYADCDLAGDGVQAYEYSLFVDARVVSANTPGMATIDAGIKALSTDGGDPVIVAGAPEGATYRFMGDEHGAIIDPAGRARWKIGDLVRLAVPHCDPTVNLYDAYHVVNADTLEAIWPVSARGRSR